MKENNFTVAGNIVDVVAKRMFQGQIDVENGRIKKITEGPCDETQYILPGLIDAHIHIESSMLIPSEFARLAVIHGTTATVSDPHEIANVLGVPGVKFMIANGQKVPFKFNFGAPSCVPATSFETSGSTLGPDEIEELMAMNEIKYLSEMMNFPGVLFKDPMVMRKLEIARRYSKPVDGHAPGLKGQEAADYAKAGISTDHECFTREEALAKISAGMKILIREGSAAKNFDELCSLIGEFPDMVMFCSDDKHPDDLEEGHINVLVRKALAKGFDLFNVIRACTYNPVKHYQLGSGLLQEGDPADFIVVGNLKEFTLEKTYIDGCLVAESGKTLIAAVEEVPFNNFNIGPIKSENLVIHGSPASIRVIEAYDGQLITGNIEARPKTQNGNLVSDPEAGILKLVVKNRYSEAPCALGFIKGFGLQKGAIASCVAHDSHNIVAVGTNDENLLKAINLVIRHRGGISVVADGSENVLPLPFAGIMTVEDGREVAAKYRRMDLLAKSLGSRLKAPFMTLSFMALLVIPSLKLSDRGLFDGNSFAFTKLFIV